MKKFAKRTGIGLLVAGALMSLIAAPSMAQDKPAAPGNAAAEDKPKNKRTTGVVVSASATTIVVKVGRRNNQTEQTFTVPATAKVSDENKQPIALEKIEAGKRVTITSAPDGTVRRVTVNKPRAQKPPA